MEEWLEAIPEHCKLRITFDISGSFTGNGSEMEGQHG